MMNTNNTMSRILADDLGLVETAVRAEKKAYGDNYYLLTTATPMMQVLAADVGATELCDPRNYPAAVKGEGFFSRLASMMKQQAEEDRARRKEMHERMLTAFADSRATA